MRNKTCIVCWNPHSNSMSKCCSGKCERTHRSNLAKANKEKIRIKKEKTKEKKAFKRSALVKEADRVFSIFIRERDRGNPCITSGKEWREDFQCGHFQSRRHLNTRWHEKNAHSQSPEDNNWWAWEQFKHWLAIDRLYGKWTAEQIMRLAQDTSKTTDEEILMHIRYYYGELAKMAVDYKPKKIYLHEL